MMDETSAKPDIADAVAADARGEHRLPCPPFPAEELARLTDDIVWR